MNKLAVTLTLLLLATSSSVAHSKDMIVSPANGVKPIIKIIPGLPEPLCKIVKAPKSKQGVNTFLVLCKEPTIKLNKSTTQL